MTNSLCITHLRLIVHEHNLSQLTCTLVRFLESKTRSSKFSCTQLRARFIDFELSIPFVATVLLFDFVDNEMASFFFTLLFSDP